MAGIYLGLRSQVNWNIEAIVGNLGAAILTMPH